MKLDEHQSHPSMRVVLDGVATTVDLAPGDFTTVFRVTHNGTILTGSAEYDPRTDTYAHMSDDGDEYYVVLRVIGPGEAAVPVPDRTQVQTASLTAMNRFLTALSLGQVSRGDLVFAQHLMSNPTFLHKAWQETGSIAAAQAKLLKEVFGI